MKSGPFGLEMGAKKDSFSFELEEIEPFLYVAKKVPKPHSLFDSYVLRIAPSNGLSWIKAIGKNIETDAYGMGVRRSFDELLEKLAATYGKPKISDYLLPDSIWNEPRDWMSSILNKERGYFALWNEENGAKLEGDLKDIFLGLHAIDTNTAFLFIEYSLRNEDAAKNEIAALEDDAL